MKKLFLILLICLVLPCPVNAEKYENHNYNFQITIPDGWKFFDPATIIYVCAFTNRSSNKDDFAAFFLQSMHVKDGDNRTLYDLPEAERRHMFESSISSISKRWPNHKITAAEYSYVGSNYSLIIAAVNPKENVSSKYFYRCFFIKNDYMYIFEFVADQKEQIPVFFNMLKSFRAIK